MITLLTVLATSALGATQYVDAVGGTSNSNAGGQDYKLNTYDVTATSILDLIEVRGASTWFNAAVTWVVYVEVTPGEWDLVASAAGQWNDQLSWQDSPPLAVPLVAGRTYAIGVALGNDEVEYFWETSANEPVSFGNRTGGMFSGNGSVVSLPNPLYDSISTIGYRQRLTVSVLDDLDGDGFLEVLDCDDSDPTVNPGATEICNDGIDQDCSGVADDYDVFVDWWPDGDGDGYGEAGATPTSTCDGPPPDFVANERDCDDTDSDVNPAGVEVCDGLDQDCDGTADNGLAFEDYWLDLDGDGYGDPGSAVASTCDGPPSGYVDNDADCDDANAMVAPDAPELCNGVSDDCDAEVDEDVVFFEIWPDSDGDGFGDASAAAEFDCDARDGWVINGDDCDDDEAQVNPDAMEICDGLDNDCDGERLPDEIDSDLDGAMDCEDCEPEDPEVFPGAEDPCNGVDNDCDGTIPTPEACDPDAGESVSIASACNCAAAGPSVPLWLFVVPLAAVRRFTRLPRWCRTE